MTCSYILSGMAQQPTLTERTKEISAQTTGSVVGTLRSSTSGIKLRSVINLRLAPHLIAPHHHQTHIRQTPDFLTVASLCVSVTQLNSGALYFLKTVGNFNYLLGAVPILYV